MCGPIVDLVADHRAALLEAEEAWCRFGELEEAHPFPTPKIQIGRRLGMRNDDGTDNWSPIYAYSEETILERCAHHESLQISMCCGDEAKAAKVRESYGALRDRKLNELREKEAAFDRHEQETGIAASRDAAYEASDEAANIMDAILASQPSSLADVRVVAGHLLDAEKYLGDDANYKEFVQLLAGRA
jgi:hypothetical protein